MARDRLCNPDSGVQVAMGAPDYADVTQLVEYRLGKAEAIGSIPIISTTAPKA